MCRIAISVSFLSTLLLLSDLAPAQESVAELVNPEAFNEQYHDEAPVSGRVIAGVAILGSNAVDRLALLAPKNYSNDSVCVQVMSRDGRYWSKNTYRLKTATDGKPVPLQYEGKHKSYLEDLRSDELAVLAYVGKCGDDPKELLPSVAIPPENEDPSTTGVGVSFFVNSGRTDTHVFVEDSDKEGSKRRKASCHLIEDGRRTGFDTVCEIHLVDQSAVCLDITITRYRYERKLSDNNFTLRLPAGTSHQCGP